MFFLTNNLILATYLAGVYDVNRNEVLQRDNLAVIEQWAQSIVALDLRAVVFHNSLTKASITKYTSHITFVKVQYDEKYNTNIFRYFLYHNFLKENTIAVQNIFVTDITDVVVLQNPFIQPLFTNNANSIFCGDEPKLLQNDWMNAHSTHLRSKIKDFALYEANFKNAPLLNCGIIGGNIFIMQLFLQKLCAIHKNYNADNKTAYTGDMGAFNYLLRTQYNQNVIHGYPVNTIFKAYQTERRDCWFRHK